MTADEGVFTMNYTGFGTIGDSVRKYNPYESVCKCECKGGIADTTEVDIIIPANVSNWGAYGIEACIAALIKEPNLMHGAEMEKRITEASVRAGACGGSFGRLTLSVGTPMEYHMSFVYVMEAIVHNWFKVRKREF